MVNLWTVNIVGEVIWRGSGRWGIGFGVSCSFWNKSSLNLEVQSMRDKSAQVNSVSRIPMFVSPQSSELWRTHVFVTRAMQKNELEQKRFESCSTAAFF